MTELLSAGDVTFWKRKPHLIESIDRCGYAHLVDCDGETAMVHRSAFDNERGFVRDCAKVIWDELCK
jgi:hypothetical protein